VPGNQDVERVFALELKLLVHRFQLLVYAPYRLGQCALHEVVVSDQTFGKLAGFCQIGKGCGHRL
jgi:hypothetical protein